MHHPWALWVLSARDAPLKKSIGQRSRTITCPRMHHEPCWLIYYQEILILEDHRNGDVLGSESFLEEVSLDPFAAACLTGRSNFAPVHLHEAFLDHTARNAPAHVEMPGDEPV
jgi:hypothetical protein